MKKKPSAPSALAAILAIASLSVFCAQAQAAPVFKYEYLPSEKCTLAKVPETDPPLRCMQIRANFQDACKRTGGAIVQQGDQRACKLDSAQAPAYDRLIGPKTGGSGPFVPAKTVTQPGPGCIKGSTETDCSGPRR